MQEAMFPVQKTEDEWAAELTPEQFRVLREHGTERPGSSPLNDEKRAGTFKCAACGQPLFDSETKYESCSGSLLKRFLLAPTSRSSTTPRNTTSNTWRRTPVGTAASVASA
jgi:peptide methionine sulfoxide reductase MsrB